MCEQKGGKDGTLWCHNKPLRQVTIAREGAILLSSPLPLDMSSTFFLVASGGERGKEGQEEFYGPSSPTYST